MSPELATYPWYLGELPFIYGPNKTPDNECGLKNFLRFTLDYDEKKRLLIQKPDMEVEGALEKAYTIGSEMTGMMDDHGIGKKYADDYLAFLTRALKKDRFDNLRIMEIGCGTGYLLHRLKELGAEVLGVEPGKQGQTGSRQYRVPVIEDYFPSQKIKDRYDIIIAYAVLEHIPRQQEFLSSVMKSLKPDGVLAISVPDCEPYVKTGDISILLHEHWAYYTQESLYRTINESCGLNLTVEKSLFGGLLYATGQNKADAVHSNGIVNYTDPHDYENYRFLAEKRIMQVRNYLKSRLDYGETVGIYIPHRIANTLALIKGDLDLSFVRFFDDNEKLKGTFLPGYSIPIETGEDFILKPPLHLLIMSRSFSKPIIEKLQICSDKLLSATTWDQLFRD